MPFTVEPLLHDDIDTFVQVWYDSFAPEQYDQILPMIYPGGLTSELRTKLKSRIMAETDGDTVEFCYCARDDETKRIVGIAWWRPLAKPTPLSSGEDVARELAESIEKKNNSGPQIADSNIPLGDAFFTELFYAERRTIKAKQVPYITLTVLGVLPDVGRQGVGSLLLEHGLKKVDSLNIHTWLCASSAGRGLYLKHGFEIVEEFNLDCTDYGGRSKGRHCIMLRPPQGE